MSQRYNDQEVTLYDLVGRLGIEYTKSNYMHCFCPECAGTKPSEKKLHLDFTKNRWRCVRCSQSGGVLRFFSGFYKGEIDLPSGKKERGKLSGELREFMGINNAAPSPPAARRTNRPQPPRVDEIYVAPDQHLNDVYTAMMQIPELQLLDKHREALRKRGLTDEQITRNGYRSVPETWKIPSVYERMYRDAGGNDRAKELFERFNSNQIKLGLMIAHRLIIKGYPLQGVPGFYRFGQFWCYWLVPGILIPTRNYQGQIVIWQVRREKLKGDMAKYITVSKQGLPGHVTTEVSRCHFPLSNAPLDRKAPVIITEGPLKADVASALFGSPTIFAAIPGVSTTNDLLRHCSLFKKISPNGKVMNAFDMDKLTNKNVRRGVKRLQEKFREQGIVMEDLHWGDSYAISKLMILSAIAQRLRIPVQIPARDTVFDRLAAVSAALDDADIDVCSVMYPDGQKRNCYWESNTKGIDDYLLWKRTH